LFLISLNCLEPDNKILDIESKPALKSKVYTLKNEIPVYENLKFDRIAVRTLEKDLTVPVNQLHIIHYSTPSNRSLNFAEIEFNRKIGYISLDSSNDSISLFKELDKPAKGIIDVNSYKSNPERKIYQYHRRRINLSGN
jgi:hypothetical protein